MASRFASLALVAATTVLPALGHTIVSYTIMVLEAVINVSLQYGPSFDWRTDAPLMASIFHPNSQSGFLRFSTGWLGAVQPLRCILGAHDVWPLGSDEYHWLEHDRQ